MLHGEEVCKRHQAALVELHLAVHGKEHRQHIGEAEAPPQAAAQSGKIAELHPHNVLDCLLNCILGIPVQPRMLLQLAQGDHGTDGEALLGFFDGVKPQAAEVDGGLHGAPSHFQPQHSAEDSAAALLVQRPRFLQTLRPDIVFDGKHMVLLCIRAFVPIFLSV